MSDASLIYDAIITELATTFPNSTRIPNAYSLPDNPETLIVDGYGVMIGASTPVDIGEFNNVTIAREYTIVFSKELFTLDGNDDGFDTIHKSLMENMKTLKNLFCKSYELGVELSIDRIELAGDSGIEFVVDDKKKYLSMSQSIIIEYRELIL